MGRAPGMTTMAEAIERYLRTGDHEQDHPEWPGQNIFEKAKRGHDDLLHALVAEVKRRSVGRRHHAVPDLDLTSWTRRKVTPMVAGLFPQVEREAVLALLERSVVFLTTDNVEKVLLGQTWLRSTCYVSTEYFGHRDAIEDFVIHEVAHVFHNCKRKTAGLPETRSKEWLLLLEFRKRETFAYSCEAYGWIVEHASSRLERITMAEEFSTHAHRMSDETIQPCEVADIVREACEARNGWKVILGRCSPPKPVRRVALLSNEVTR